VKILITGGCGYIGSMLCRKLLESNLPIDKLTVIDSLLYKQTSLMDLCYRENFRFIHGDVRYLEDFKEIITESDVIIPLAAYVGFPVCEREKDLATQVNFNQIEKLLSLTSAKQMIIFPNTNSGYGVGEKDLFCTEDTPLRPISHYGITKTNAEIMLLESCRAISLRLATVFGISPRMRIDLLVNDFVFRAVRDGYIILFEKDFKRNFIHVQDVSNAFIFMIEHYHNYVGNAFNVGLSDANLSKLELCQKIKEHVPNFEIEVNDFASDPDKRNYIVSNAKIEAAGWSPTFSLDDGIRELVQAYPMLIHNMRNYTNL
jgi:nucleoside-diphosphate-sugar epimerase